MAPSRIKSWQPPDEGRSMGPGTAESGANFGRRKNNTGDVTMILGASKEGRATVINNDVEDNIVKVF